MLPVQDCSRGERYSLTRLLFFTPEESALLARGGSPEIKSLQITFRPEGAVLGSGPQLNRSQNVSGKALAAGFCSATAASALPLRICGPEPRSDRSDEAAGLSKDGPIRGDGNACADFFSGLPPRANKDGPSGADPKATDN